MVLSILDFLINLDVHLNEIINAYGVWTYLVIFLVVFLETGVVVTPFLPGDSLIFVIGALAAVGEINTLVITIVLILAAIIGDTVNYHIGKFIGPRVFRENVRLFKKEHLIRTQNFYEKHGGKTIVLARFIPIIRTFAPFVAGIGSMSYGRFILFNAAGGAAWVVFFMCLGYFFGNVPIVKDNFSLVIPLIILISLLPVLVDILRQRNRRPPSA